MSSDTLTFEDWDVTFTDGARVTIIKEHKSHTDILLKNLSSSFSNAQLQAEISKFGSASVMRDSRKKRARVRFLDAGTAAIAMADLDNKRLGVSRVEAILDRSKDKQWIEDGILLVYDACHTTAQVAFKNPTEATEGLKLHRSIFQGRRIRLTRENELNLYVEELPAMVDADDLLTFFMADSVSITRDFGEEADISELLQSLIREQPGCASLQLAPLQTEPEQGAGWIRMSNEERAAEVSKEIRGLRPIFLGGNTVHTRRAQAVVWKLVPDHHTVVHSELQNLNFDDVYIQYDPDTTEEVELRLVASDLGKLRAAKETINGILEGEVWNEDGTPLWDRFWTTPEGKIAIQDANEIAGVHVDVSLSKRSVRIIGQQEGREIAKLLLQKKLEELDQRAHFIKLPKDEMEYFLEHGAPRLTNILSAFSTTVGRSKDILFHGNDITRQLFFNILDQCATEVSIRNAGASRPTCPVCTSAVVEPFSLECGHTYCLECLNHMLGSASAVPVECVAEGCRQAPSLRILRHILSPPQYRRLLETAFQAYLRHNDKFHPCPTVGCLQIWTINPTAKANIQIAQCSCCLVRICVVCKVEEHAGITCEEQQRAIASQRSERQFATWKAERGIKSCPSCSRDVEKIDGCPHIHCSQCNAHWCWECGRVASRPAIIYAHIRRRHGREARRYLAPVDLGDPNIEMVNLG